MAYADQQMSGSRVVAIALVILIHLALGYALITGLAYSAFETVRDVVTTVDITEPPPPEPEPEPPPPQEEPVPQPVTTPPPVAPQPPIRISPAPPNIVTTTQISPPAPPVLRIPPAAVPGPPSPPAPPPPAPPPSAPPSAASPRGNPGSWANTNDYPARALRNGDEGTTGVRLNVGTDGRVTNCEVTRSSGSNELDTTTCRLLERRGRFNPATQNGQPVASTWSTSILWQIPD